MAVQKQAPDDRMATEAIEEAYQAYRGEIRRFMARRLRHAGESEDLVQDLYTRLLRFPPRGPLKELRAYLYQVARHVVFDANRRAEENPVEPCEPSALARLTERSEGSLTDEFDHQMATEQQFARVLGQLPKICQAAILRLKRDGLSYRQVAAELGISVAMLEKHVARAIAHFKAADWKR